MNLREFLEHAYLEPIDLNDAELEDIHKDLDEIKQAFLDDDKHKLAVLAIKYVFISYGVID